MANLNYNGFWCEKKDLKQYVKLKIKKRKVAEDIKFINKCLKSKIVPNFVRKYVKHNLNDPKQRAAEKSVLEVEKNKHYKVLSDLDLKTYNLHLKIIKQVGNQVWDNLEDRLYDMLDFHIKQKRRILDNKFDKFEQQQKKTRSNKENVKISTNNVVNLSNQEFGKEEISFLNQGLKTCVDFCDEKEEYIANIEIAIQHLNEDKKCVVRNKCGNILEQIGNTRKDYKKNAYKKIVKSLNSKPVVYQKADKGNKIVILDRGDYNNNMEELLNSDNFTEIKKDPIKNCIKTVNTTINKMKKVFIKKEKQIVKTYNPTIPKIYGLPKIHKPGRKLRPIISCIGAPNYNLAKWLVKKFQGFPSFETLSIKNSFELIEKIENINLSDDDCLVSFDVCSLFPSIPKGKLLKIMENWFTSLGMEKEEILEYLELINLCINQNFFKFGNKFYEQKSGLAMGNPLSPLLANLFMSNFELHITNAFPWMFKTWWRYVDDIFSIVNKKHISDVLKLLNIQDSNINFTMETESNNCLPFLDLKILKNNCKIEFGIFRKDTHTDNYIKENSYNPIPHKHAIINSLSHRLVNVPLNKTEYNEEYNHIIHIAKINGFKKSLVDKKIKKYIRQKEIKKISTLSNIKENVRYKKFVYHPKLNHKFKKVFKEVNITLAVQNKFNIKTLIKANFKDKEPDSKKSGIYEIKCKDCNKLYIGQTKRNIDTRKKEHFRNIKFDQREKSAVAAHFWEESHDIEEEVKLLKHINNPMELTVWEKIFIQKNKNKIMNFEIPFESSLISKYIQQPPEATVAQLPNVQPVSH